MVEDILPVLKIKKIDAPQADARDVISRLRATWLGQIYVSYLKQHIVIHWIARWVWRNGYPIYANYISTRLLNRNAKRWRALVSLDEYAKNKGLSINKLVGEVLINVPMPKVFPVCEQGYLESPCDQYVFPEIYVTTISDALIYGGTNLILADDEVVCHDLYDFELDYTSEELHGRTLVNSKSSRIRWLQHDKQPEIVPVAAAFVDACALNYAHWMTEVLPRINLFCADERFKNVPIVVNDGLHKNIMESLALVAGSDREIILLPIGRALAVKELYVTSVAGYVPFERRKTKLLGHSHGVFSSTAFELVRNKVFSVTKIVTEHDWPEKIYLRRNSGIRKIANSVSVEKFLNGQGYVSIDPEKLSFLEQVRLFNGAKKIISPTGAALSNAIFCEPGTHIGVLMAKHENMIYGYWVNMLCPLGVAVSYVLGDIVDNRANGIHADFEISKNNINELLWSWEAR